jgi:hypothetical protein
VGFVSRRRPPSCSSSGTGVQACRVQIIRIAASSVLDKPIWCYSYYLTIVVLLDFYLSSGYFLPGAAEMRGAGVLLSTW